MTFDEETRRKIAANKRNWDARAPIHVASNFYGIGERDPLNWFAAFEWRDLGDLAGRDVLHLQCHLGVETMALALKGARTTGLDISGVSVHEARRIAHDAGLAIEYVQADVYDAAAALGERRFDVVYTGKGALCYLPDLSEWAATVARLLKPGGFLYVAEFHPLLNALGPTQKPHDGADLLLRYDYLGGGGAVERNSQYSYTDGPALEGDTVHYEWPHGLGEVVTALAITGFTVASLTETRLLPWRRWPQMVRNDGGWWEMPPNEPRIPLLYGLKAGFAGYGMRR